MISDYAAKKEFIVEMEKSAAIMSHYDAEFALASIFIPDKVLPPVFIPEVAFSLHMHTTVCICNT